MIRGQGKYIKVGPRASCPRFQCGAFPYTQRRDHIRMYTCGRSDFQLPVDIWKSLTFMTPGRLLFRNIDTTGLSLFLLEVCVLKYILLSYFSPVANTLDSPSQSGERFNAFSLMTEWENFNWDRREVGLPISEIQLFHY